MKAVQQIVAEKQADFARHPFFRSLQKYTKMDQALRFAPRLTFWVLAFQDVLRLNEQLVRDPELRRIVLRHRAEDAGHDKWFLADVAALGAAAPGARDLFSAGHAPVRDATYNLMAETIGASDERLRVVLLLTLEAVGHVFFDRVSALVDTLGGTQALKYFSLHHYDLERDHHLFEEGHEDELDRIVLPRRVRGEAAAMIGRTFAAFDSMFEGLQLESELGDRPAAFAPTVVRGERRDRE